MSVEDYLATFLTLFVLGGIVAAANIADRDKNARLGGLVVVILGLVNVLIAGLYGFLQVLRAYSETSDSVPTRAEAWGSLTAALVVSGLATVVLVPSARQRLAAIFPRYRTKSKREPQALVAQPDLQTNTTGTPLFPQMLNYYTTESMLMPRPSVGLEAQSTDEGDYRYEARGFNPRSSVHMVAVVFSVYLVGIQFVNFILEGGLSGVAQSFEGGLSGWDLLLNGLPLLIIPVIGVGLGMRRNLSQTLDRLGLKVPSLEGIMVSFGLTIALFVFVATVSAIWMGVVSKETYEEQTQASDALSDSVTTIGLAFLLAASAAVSEEIAFRGALQPVLGFWPTAIIFALTHAQYTLTPASLIILGVAAGFGWIRQRYSTTVSILTHFMYNFIPLALTVAAADGSASFILHLLGA